MAAVVIGRLKMKNHRKYLTNIRSSLKADLTALEAVCLVPKAIIEAAAPLCEITERIEY
jgi:hypothetical protein